MSIPIVDRKERNRSAQEAPRRRHIPPGVGSAARRSQRMSGTRPEDADALTGHAELDEIAVRGLEVIAEDLLLLLDAVSSHAFEPSCEAFVVLRPELLRHRLVRRIADQQMTEAERVIAGDRRPGGPHELLPHQRHHVLRDLGPESRGCQLSNRAQEEPLTRHRSGLEHHALARGKPVQPRCEQRRDRRGDRHL